MQFLFKGRLIICYGFIKFVPFYLFSDGSFAESLYGLRRRAVKIKVKGDNKGPDAREEINHTGLEKRQKILSVVFLVISYTGILTYVVVHEFLLF